ncbi:hypothetical protein V6N12_015056 [Hibiscus sabdariffa]|uniref:MADS-box domain-containing protein n=1 Tax=Hibiscus sabdariffa TaxID=183260 RepID=A0ABR2DM14_9ROSI
MIEAGMVEALKSKPKRSKVVGTKGQVRSSTATTSKLVQTSGRLSAQEHPKNKNNKKKIKSRSMGRGRVQMKRIENPVHRQVTFCKRRAGLLKKAKELSVLCDAEIGLVIFSAHGKLYELATKGTMQELIERYGKYTGGPQLPDEVPMVEPLDAKKEIDMLKQEIQVLQKDGHHGSRNSNVKEQG